MTVLTTKQVYVMPPSPVAVPVPFVKPVSYEFRVAEHLNKDGSIARVGLQVQVWEHDEFGGGEVKQYWTDVPRYKFNEHGTMITP